MTQVSNLTGGMGTAVKTAALSKQDSSKELLAEFAGIMNQNVQNFMNTWNEYDTSSGEIVDRTGFSGDTTDALKNNYESFGSSGGRTITKAEPERMDHETVVRDVQQLANEVKDAVKETMQVSEEDVAQAMEALGFTAFDLLKPQNLIGLVQELTGNADVSVLLTDSNFQSMMQEVTGLISGFQQEHGWNAVQFSDLLEQLSAQIDELEETVKKLLNIEGTSETEQLPDQQTVDASEELVISEAGSDKTMQISSEHKADSEVQNGQMQYSQNVDRQNVQDPMADSSELKTVQTGEPDQVLAQMEDQTSDQEGTSTSQDKKDEKQTVFTGSEQKDFITEPHAGMIHEHTAVSENPISAAQPEVPQVEAYVELQHLMDQMEGLARTFASSEGTTVEMQLNPENLGRLVLSVTEKHGNVTAQITASNEQVKETLQAQLVELRSTLQAQGIKVEAVEVTVATHEFEQNLDGNASANGQMQEQNGGQHSEGQRGRRNLNLNNLDELSGLMSEEETLVAQMMRDNGGTVDYTA